MDNKNHPHSDNTSTESSKGMIDKLLWYCLHNQLLVWLLAITVILGGIMVAPFDWSTTILPRDPVPVDAIPDIGENQQVIFTPWAGRSPQDVEDQITYPLSSALLGLPGVKTIRAFSMFGFSSIYVIFDENIDFYWSRSRILEKLNSLPSNTLPPQVQPSLGPDATALGQVYWYTLEGRDSKGNPTGGWDLDELRTIQDWTVRYALLSARGISEVASVGGFVKEYQVDVDPDALRAFDITLQDVMKAVQASNIDVGARTMEVNRVEYVIRGVGLIKSIDDLEQTIVDIKGESPVFLKDIASVVLGPGLRRGALNKGGVEAVGGVAVVRYGFNPLESIQNLKEKIAEIAPTLPQKQLADGTISQVQIIPFYDRSTLIEETLETLNHALILEVTIAVIVTLALLRHLGSSLLISSTVPLAILACFILMKLFGIDANIVSLSGIAIAIGTMVDAGVVICENILRHLNLPSTNNQDKQSRLVAIWNGSREVASSVFTAILTTVVSFLPVFAMQAAEGKLFKPLAFTKTFALIGSIVVALTLIPVASWAILRVNRKSRKNAFDWRIVGIIAILSTFLTLQWMPLGYEQSTVKNLIFVVLLLGVTLLIFHSLQHLLPKLIRIALRHKKTFLTLPIFSVLTSLLIWAGAPTLLGWLPPTLTRCGPIAYVHNWFPGLSKEFLPPLDEGSYLYMPVTMPHASISEVQDILATQNSHVQSIPEVELAVGKLGRVESALDPAPISMIETVIQYKSEFLSDKSGRILRFAYDASESDWVQDVVGQRLPAADGIPYKIQGKFLRSEQGNLISTSFGQPFRQWRPPLDSALNPNRDPWEGIQAPEDIWNEIIQAASIPGTTTAPKLQPIIARIVMLQSGMRAPMGIKIKGPTLELIEKAGLELEKALKQVPAIEASTVTADRVIAKPYMEINIDRESIARYGISPAKIQHSIEAAIGGAGLTTTIEGRERYSARVRYLRELRDQFHSLGDILIPSSAGAHIPLYQLAEIRYVNGPQVIKSEDGFLVSYLTFDKKDSVSEVDAVTQAQQHLSEGILDGSITLPPNTSYAFAGNFENQARAEKMLRLVVPVTLAIILVILYLRFSSLAVSLFIFTSILTAWSGGFILIWLYGSEWFLNFEILGTNLRALFQMHPINLSVAVWVGFLALFGIASDNSVLLAAKLDQDVGSKQWKSVQGLHDAICSACKQRIRPAMITSATTLLALLPVLTATGRGADIMIPMAIPSVGGMVLSVLTLYLLPLLYAMREERKISKNHSA